MGCARVAHKAEPAATDNGGVKFQLLSDLHLETQPDQRFSPAPGADFLVLAGDVGSYQPGSALPGEDFGLERFSPRNGWPVPVLFVPGNHEYDNLDFDDTHARLRETCGRLGITWLERETLLLDGVRFIGTTLWTDFDALAAQAPDTTRALKWREKAFRAANFYLPKTGATRRGQPLLAQEWRELGLECQQWLRGELARPFDGTTVVVTHFAPSLRSADPRYGLTPGTAGFCNALDELLPHAQLWVHGHLHCHHDYQVDGCRVVANPPGYARKGEQEGFLPHFTVQVPAAPAGVNAR
jgi:predicted phosphodiesterase